VRFPLFWVKKFLLPFHFQFEVFGIQNKGIPSILLLKPPENAVFLSHRLRKYFNSLTFPHPFFEINNISISSKFLNLKKIYFSLIWENKCLNTNTCSWFEPVKFIFSFFVYFSPLLPSLYSFEEDITRHQRKIRKISLPKWEKLTTFSFFSLKFLLHCFFFFTFQIFLSYTTCVLLTQKFYWKLFWSSRFLFFLTLSPIYPFC
jgi:hypothetical protein